MSDRAKKAQDFVYVITTSPGALSRANVTEAFARITTAVFSRDDNDINNGLDALYVLSRALDARARPEPVTERSCE